MNCSSSEAGLPFRTIGGRFFRCVLAERVGEALTPPGSASAGRYHRLGQPTLYLSPEMDWAIISVSGYMREDGRPRVVVSVEVSSASVLDQRDAEACPTLGIDRERSDASWREALAAGREPPSWRNADIARSAGADGIVDRSRKILDGWHLNLFRWNAGGGPQVRIVGEPRKVTLTQGGLKWGL